MNNKKNRVVGRTVFLSIIAMLVFTAYAFLQINSYEEGMAEIYADEQDGYVALVSEQVKKGEIMPQDAEDTVSALGDDNDRYWTLDDKSTILYIKNVTETNQYRNVEPEKYYSSKSAKKFISNLEEGTVSHSMISIDNTKYIASGTIEVVDNQIIRMVLLTDYKILFSHNLYLSNKIFLEIAILAVAISS